MKEFQLFFFPTTTYVFIATLVFLLLTLSVYLIINYSITAEAQITNNSNINNSNNYPISINNTSIINKNIDNTAQMNFLTYQNSSLGFNISYPSNWQVNPKGKGVTFLSPIQGTRDTYRDYVRVSVLNFNSSNNTLEKYVQRDLNVLKSFFINFDPILSHSIAIGNNTANQIIYTALIKGPHPHIITGSKSFVAHDDNIYLITFEAEVGKFSKFQPTVEKMINSFKITAH